MGKDVQLAQTPALFDSQSFQCLSALNLLVLDFLEDTAFLMKKSFMHKWEIGILIFDDVSHEPLCSKVLSSNLEKPSLGNFFYEGRGSWALGLGSSKLVSADLEHMSLLVCCFSMLQNCRSANVEVRD